MSLFLQAINDKIKQLDFQECKVRVLNVDSQASFDNILVAVIGEISNKSEPSRKFVQTFVLAEQPNGYYVLNDIFRYLVDEEEELMEEAAEPTTEAPQVAEAAPVAEAQVTDEVAAAKVDEKLEQETNGTVEQPEEVAPQVNGTPAQEEETPAPTPAEVEPEVVNNEKPATPEPSPAPEQKEVPVEKEAAPTPAIPKTWATIASSIKAGAAAPVVPAIPAAAPKAAATTAAPAATAAPSTNSPKPAAAQNATPAPATETRSQDASSNDGAGWQTAGADHKKTQSRAGEEQTVLGYIKNVTDKIDSAQLKQTMSRFGKLKYFDVSRPKVRLTLIPLSIYSDCFILFQWTTLLTGYV